MRATITNIVEQLLENKLVIANVANKLYGIWRAWLRSGAPSYVLN
jgi:hypothetical protein